MMTSAKQKIVFILPALIAGGAERVLITLMNSLDRNRYDVSFIAISETGTLKSLIDSDIPVYSLKGKGVFRSLRRLYCHIKKIEPDIVVSTMVHMNFAVLLLKPWLPNTRFIVREAITPSFILDEHPLLAPVIRVGYRILYARANLVISPAQIIIDELSEMNIACGKHVLLRNPVSIDSVKGQVSANRVADKRGVHFVAAGRLHIQKGFDRLITLLPELNLSGDWCLSILGEGEERCALGAMIEERRLKDSVCLTGLKSDPWSIISEADCFLLPSRWEGLPNVVLESLACGTPVIAMSSAGGIQEIADLAPPGAVVVVNTMEEFKTEMEKVRPKSSSNQDSLLPDEFLEERVKAEFSSLLAGVV